MCSLKYCIFLSRCRGARFISLLLESRARQFESDHLDQIDVFCTFTFFYIFINMGRKQKKYHFIYKTTNVLSGKYYIGMHSTDNLEDGYLGSGTRLRYSINKHGKENHKLDILEFCESRELLKEREEEIVSLNEIAKKDCINLKVGGYGGLSDEEHHQNFIEAGKQNLINTKEKREASLKITRSSLEYKEKMRKMKKEYYENNVGTFKGKKHSDETKMKMRKPKNKRESNSQFGSRWITNEKENIKLYPNQFIPEGWRLGRVIK